MSLFSSVTFAVLQKELRDTLRDKRSLLTFAVFVAMYPLMMMMGINVGIKTATSGDTQEIRILIAGAEQAPRLVADLQAEGIKLIDEPLLDEAAIADRLSSRAIAAALVIPASYAEEYQSLKPAKLQLWVNSTSNQGAKLRKVREILQSYEAFTAQARLLQRGVAPSLINPIAVQEFDTATAASRSSLLAGSMLGFMFVFAFFFCLNAALDSTAGERDRKSLEILMVQPARASQIVIGKWMAAALISMVGLSANLIAAHMVLSNMPLEEIGMSWQLGWGRLLLALLLALPLCAFAAAFEIAFALNSKSLKEAQTSMGIVMLIPMLPLLIVIFTSAETAAWMFSIPVLGEQELMKAMAKNENLEWWQYLAPGATSALLATACLLFASRKMASEKFVLGI